MSAKEIALKMLPGLTAAWSGVTCFIIHELWIEAGRSAAVYGVGPDEETAWREAVEWLKSLGFGDQAAK